MKTEDGNLETVDNGEVVKVTKPASKTKVSKDTKSTMKQNYESRLSMEQRKKAAEKAATLTPKESKKNMFDAIKNNCK